MLIIVYLKVPEGLEVPALDDLQKGGDLLLLVRLPADDGPQLLKHLVVQRRRLLHARDQVEQELDVLLLRGSHQRQLKDARRQFARQVLADLRKQLIHRHLKVDVY